MVSIHEEMHQVFLLLGSNLGDSRAVLSQALEQIVAAVGNLRAASSLYETEPWGVTEQPVFLNQVLHIETQLSPEAVLTNVLSIEKILGRERHERWGARVIDIDILYYDDLVVETPSLIIPHPRLHERQFTLVPLSEIAPDFCHPVLKKTTAQLLDICQDHSLVHRIS